jgi:hypothetical protein
MKIRDYEERLEYVERHRDEMLGFIAAEEPDATPDTLFSQFAEEAQRRGTTPDEQLLAIWGYYKARYEKAREIAGTLHQFFYGEPQSQGQTQLASPERF